jgi:hypothetical protein
MAVAVFVTGHKELDAKLAKMPAALQKKLIRGGLRKAGKRIQRDFKGIVKAEAYISGALHSSTTIRAKKRSRVSAGIEMGVDYGKLEANYAAKHEGKTPSPAKSGQGPFPYIVALEFGTDTQPPEKPLRRSLYDRILTLRSYFVADLLQFIAENKVSLKVSRLYKNFKNIKGTKAASRKQFKAIKF